VHFLLYTNIYIYMYIYIKKYIYMIHTRTHTHTPHTHTHTHRHKLMQSYVGICTCESRMNQATVIERCKIQEINYVRSVCRRGIRLALLREARKFHSVECVRSAVLWRKSKEHEYSTHSSRLLSIGDDRSLGDGSDKG